MKRTAAIATFCLQASAGAVFGAEDNNKPKTDAFTLGEVVVSSPQQPPPAGQIATEVTQEDIKAKGARTFDEALRAVPGVIVSSGPQGVPRIMIRGLPPRETQIFLNGTPLNSAADGQPDPTLVPTENIDHIEIIQGASSVLYGPGTTAGAIDIVTKKGTTGTHGDAGSEIGTGNARRIYGDLYGGFSDFDYFVSGSHTARDSYPVPGDGFRANSDLQRSNFFGNFGAKIGDWRFGLTLSTVNGNQGLPPNTIANAAGNLFTSGQKFERLDRIAGQTAQFDAAYLPGGPFSLRTTAYVNASSIADNMYDNASYNTMINPGVQTFRETINTVVSGGRTQAQYEFGAFGTLTSSLSLRHEQETITGVIRNVPLTTAGSGTGAGAGKGTGKGTGGGTGTGPATTTYAFANLNQDDGITTYSAAVEYKVDPFARTHVSAGYSHHWFSGATGLDQGDQGVVGLAYDLTQTLQAFGSFAHKIRFPTIDQLYNPQMGNAALVPEVSDNLEGGLTWRPVPAAQVTASVFKNRVSNFILNNMITQSYFNSDVVISGVQANASYVVFDGLTVRPGYTYLDVRYPSTDLPVDYRPHHVVDLLTTFAPGANWLLSADASYVAAQSVGQRSNAAIRLGLSNYAVLNAKIQKSFPDLGLDMYVRATNLTDTPYAYAVGFPAPGRTLYAGLEYHF